MAKRIIRMGDDPILKKKSRDVVVFDARLHQLLDDMCETMAEANGVGLAAVQVGVLRRVIIIDVGEGVTELINPVIIQESEELITEAEACLSYPGESGLVPRPKQVTVQAQNRTGDLITLTGEDLLARAICHETDHTNGIVFKDLALEMLDDDDLTEED